jgi:hypothetical protein
MSHADKSQSVSRLADTRKKNPGEMLPSPRDPSSDQRLLLDILYEFIGAFRHEDPFLPDHAELTGDLGSDRNLHKVSGIGWQNGI